MVEMYTINETRAAVSHMANGETRMIVGTISGTKSYRFCAAQTHWFDGQLTQPPSVSFHAYETGRPINASGALKNQREAILSCPEVIAALTKREANRCAT